MLASAVAATATGAAAPPVQRLLRGLPACPSTPAVLGSCPPEDLGPEILADPLLATLGSPRSSWHTHLSEPDLATFASNSAGAVVTVQGRTDPHAYDVILHRTVSLNASDSYELCVQAGAATAGKDLRFAVDGGTEGNFAVAGGKQRAHLVTVAGSLETTCFRFKPSEAGAAGAYSGRVALEFGTVSGDMAICQASLRRCTGRPVLSDLCPKTPVKLDAWKCPEADLGEELLRDPGLSSGAAWEQHMWQYEGAKFTFGAPGMFVDVKQHADAQLFDVQAFQYVPLNASGGASYELCVQANSTADGNQIRFAVDGGSAMNFTTAGGGKQRTFIDIPKAYLVTSCFRFSLPDSVQMYPGRVDIEFGTAKGRVSVCQASLRRCWTPPTTAPAPMRRCHLAPLSKGAACEHLGSLTGPSFALNAYGQETTAARACLARARNASADAFEISAGLCELWRCGTRDKLMAAAMGKPTGAALYSEHCHYGEIVGGIWGRERRSPVFIQLWDWNFLDVARECEDFLGPNGFDGVQVAPVTEHILGGTWWTKYQPVSFLLESRSGSRRQLEEMVRRCRAAGVQVIVDVILNHIARPCDAVSKVGRGAGMPCVGWAGSRYGNRRMGGTEGWPLMTPDNFHHKRADKLRNCPVEKDTFQCPESFPPNDCSLCDLYGMPDWRTGEADMQEILWRHLEELHDIGVTMLRIDAASYMHPEDLAAFMNRAPWDFVVQEWWGGVPEAERSHFVGHYRDYTYGMKIVEALTGDSSKLVDLLSISGGNDGVPPEQAVCTLTDHDQKKDVSYKSGLEYHQQQKWMLAWPEGHSVRLFGGFGWATSEDGPPGCENGHERCQPTSVFSGPSGAATCMATPQRSPLDLGLANKRVWICEHRWEGVAGLVNFRKACRGLPVEQKWVDPAAGHLAFRAGGTCFAALQKGYNREARHARRWGDWSLAGLEVGLPPGRYCDLGSLPMAKGWLPLRCPREVTIGADGRIASGYVPEGDVLAIHVGALLPNTTEAAQDEYDRTIPVGDARTLRPTCLVQGLLLLSLSAFLGYV